jgi:hypothetical protein
MLIGTHSLRPSLQMSCSFGRNQSWNGGECTPPPTQGIGIGGGHSVEPGQVDWVTLQTWIFVTPSSGLSHAGTTWHNCLLAQRPSHILPLEVFPPTRVSCSKETHPMFNSNRPWDRQEFSNAPPSDSCSYLNSCWGPRETQLYICGLKSLSQIRQNDNF